MGYIGELRNSYDRGKINVKEIADSAYKRGFENGVRYKGIERKEKAIENIKSLEVQNLSMREREIVAQLKNDIVQMINESW